MFGVKFKQRRYVNPAYVCYCSIIIELNDI